MNFTGGSFVFAPFQLFQHIPCLVISQVQTSTNSFNALRLFALTTPFVILRICFPFTTPAATLVPGAISFTFLSSVSSSKLGLPVFLKVGLTTLHLAFQEFIVVLFQLYLAYLDKNFLIDDAVPSTFAYMPTSFFIVSVTVFQDTLLFNQTIFVFLQQPELIQRLRYHQWLILLR